MLPTSTLRPTMNKRWHRDLWMTYIAQTIIATKPAAYPNIGDIWAGTQGAHSREDHQLTEQEKREVIDILRDQHSRALAEGLSLRTEILKLCAGQDNQVAHPYHLVVYAYRDMKQDGGESIANDVCEEMLKLYDVMLKDQPCNDAIKDHRLSLRRVLIRFCRESNFYPKSLHLQIKSVETDSTVFGSFADIYRGKDYTGADLALKTLRLARRDVTSKKKAMVAEAIMLSRLKHDNVLQFVGLFHETRKEFELTYIVSPWMVHGDILRCMQGLQTNNQAIPRLRWIYEIACGLEYLHEEYIVHGDLHEGNILVDDDMHLRIADFGLSSIDEPTDTGRFTVVDIRGTAWSAPELVDEGAIPSFASDVWAFGCACLLVWTGEGPFRGCKGLAQVVRQLIVERRTPEEPNFPINSFHENDDQAKQAEILQEKVTSRCWSFILEFRPTMKDLIATLEDFKPFDG